jgi:hypothetical protein
MQFWLSYICTGKELGSGRVEIPFDITHYIISLLEPAPQPNSFVVDVATMKRLCLVSRTFNAAANAVLYSSITISEAIAPLLIATARDNPSLLHHCHSLWFKAQTKGSLTWVTIAQIVCACPNLRRVAWLRDFGAPVMSMSMWSEHLPQMTDLVFVYFPPMLRSINSTHCFPRLERLVIGEASLQDHTVVNVLLRMPHLTDLVTDPPSEVDVELFAQGIATVVAGTALRRIIWARLYSFIDSARTPLLSEFEKYIPICARAHELLSAPDGRHGLTFEFVPWSLLTVRSHILDGTIWKRDDEDRARICP